MRRIGDRSIVKHLVVACLGIVCLVVFAKMIIGPFTDWYFAEESVLFEAIGQFWQDNFHFFRLPHFDWHSDRFLYPYGLDVTFINWGFEQDVFFSFVQALGITAWGQWYYVLSLAVTFFGAYFLLWRRKGSAWALVFSFVLAFCNYAAICKFPKHYALCIVHWGIISIMLDVILVEKFWAGERVSARFALAKVLVLFLCLGLELGYVAGFACFSFFVVCSYLILAKLAETRSFPLVGKWIAGEARNVLRTFPLSRWNPLLLVLISLVAWVYLPVILQIMTHTPVQEGVTINPTNPLRVFHPILPGFNPATTSALGRGLMGRNVIDTIYAWSAGWSALLFCYFGIAVGGLKGIRKWLPFILILLAAMLMYHFPIMARFPAFKYARFPERFSPYLNCLLLVPLILAIRPCGSRRRFNRVWTIVFIPACLLWGIEIVTAYTQTFLWKDMYRITSFAPDYRQAVETVRKLPGEALFFMPFSAHGGDANGMIGFHWLTAHQMQFAARCGRKMNGCYIGRMFPDPYLKDFNRIPWESFMNGQTWTPQMWAVLKSFFKATDFSACVIDRTALTAAQYNDIVEHVGPSTASFDLCGQRYEVIPLPGELRGGRKDMESVLKLEIKER